MASYSGEQYGLPTVFGTSSYWAGRWEFDIDKTGPNTYSFRARTYIRLTGSGKAAQCTRTAWGDYRTPRFSVVIPELGIELETYGPYGPIYSGGPWTQFLSELSGSFTVTTSMTINPYMTLYTGWGSSLGTNLAAIDTWWPGVGPIAVSGVTPPKITNVRCTGKTSSSISMAFDVDWGGETVTKDPACVLRDSAGNQIAVIRNGTTSGTFTGLSRYTPYYIVGYAGNSAGSVYSSPVLVYTDPEIPTIAAPKVSNYNVTSPIQGKASVTVTPGVVTDNGGKAIQKIETFIIGGQYGSTLTSIGTGSGAKTLSNLLPNTEYQVVTLATNGITQNYSSYTKFTTIGNPPELTDVYADNISPTSATIRYVAKYEYNAKYKNYQVQWRYPGSTTWNNLTQSTNTISFNTVSTDRIEYRITVTDNWNRSTTSPTYSFVILEDISNYISDLSVKTNTNGTYTISGTWNEKAYNKSNIVLALGREDTQYEVEKVGELTKSKTNFSYTTKQYRNKMLDKTLQLFIKPSCSNAIAKTVTIKKDDYPNAMNIIKSNNTVNSVPFTSIFQNGTKKTLRPHDIVKLSRTMRYIVLDSKGTSDLSSKSSGTVDFGLGTFTYSVRHISRTLYMFSIQSMTIKTSKTVRIRNNTIKLTVSVNSNSNNIFSWWLPNGTYNTSGVNVDTVEYYSYFDIKGKEDQTITITFTTNQYAEFDTTDFTKTSTKTFMADSSDIVNNHLCKINVYDKDGNNISSGKSIKLMDGNNALVRNGCNPTTATYNSNNFVYSTSGSPLVLDLGTEYEISKIEVWRRTLDRNYSRCYVHGRNRDKELCYIFFDSNIQEYTETTSGQKIDVN